MLADQPKQSLRRCLYSIYHPSHKPDPLVVPPSASSSLAIFRYLIGTSHLICYFGGGGNLDERGTNEQPTPPTIRTSEMPQWAIALSVISINIANTVSVCVFVEGDDFLKIEGCGGEDKRTNLEGRNKGPPAYKDPSRVAPSRYLRWLSRCLKRIHPSP